MRRWQSADPGVTSGAVGSDANNLVFLSYYGPSASPQPLWRQITFSPSAGTLTETTHAVTGTSSNWTRGTQQGPVRTLLTNVAAQSGISVFRYYAYQPYAGTTGQNIMLIPDGTNVVPSTRAMPNLPLSTSSGLSASDADSTVEVVISLSVGASAGTDHTPSQSVSAPITDAVSLRFTTPPNYVGAAVSSSSVGPCL